MSTYNKPLAPRGFCGFPMEKDYNTVSPFSRETQLVKSACESPTIAIATIGHC